MRSIFLLFIILFSMQSSFAVTQEDQVLLNKSKVLILQKTYQFNFCLSYFAVIHGRFPGTLAELEDYMKSAPYQYSPDGIFEYSAKDSTMYQYMVYFTVSDSQIAQDAIAFKEFTCRATWNAMDSLDYVLPGSIEIINASLSVSGKDSLLSEKKIVLRKSDTMMKEAARKEIAFVNSYGSNTPEYLLFERLFAIKNRKFEQMLTLFDPKEVKKLKDIFRPLSSGKYKRALPQLFPKNATDFTGKTIPIEKIFAAMMNSSSMMQILDFFKVDTTTYKIGEIKREGENVYVSVKMKFLYRGIVMDENGTELLVYRNGKYYLKIFEQSSDVFKSMVENAKKELDFQDKQNKKQLPAKKKTK